MSKIDSDPLAIKQSLKEKLKGKSRRRRESLTRLAEPGAAPRRLRNDVLPQLEIVYVPLDNLRSPVRKVRVRDAAHVREVAASISALGFCDPILIGNDNVVLDGEARLEAAKLLGLLSVPCIRVGHLTAVEQRLLRLALNRVGEKGRWDLDELKIEFEELILDDAPIEISGFSPDEIDQIVIGDELEAVEQGPLAPAPGAVAVARPGDIFRLGPHRLICGDATDPIVLRRLMEGDPPARLLLTDEPYNVKIAGHVTGGAHREFAMASGEMTDVEFLAFNVAWIEAALPFLCDGGVFGTFIDWRGAPTVSSAAARLGLTPLNLIVWAKTNAGMGSLYRSQHELLPLFKKGDDPHVNNIELGRRGRWRSNVWNYPGASSLGSDARRGLQDHPTVKPTAMLEDALLDLTNRGDIVLDPFLGSGSTLIAADKAGRVCRGVELDPVYVDVIVRRYEAVTGEAVVLTETGETFAALDVRRLSTATHSPSAPTSGLEEEAIDPAACAPSHSNDVGDDIRPALIPDAVSTTEVNTIDAIEGPDADIQSPLEDVADELASMSNSVAGGSEADPQSVVAGEDARREADNAEKIAAATLDPEDGATARANSTSSVNETSPGVAPPRSEKQAPSGDNSAVIWSVDHGEAVKTTLAFDDIDVGADSGITQNHCANDDIAGESVLWADDGSLDGLADPGTTFVEAEASDDLDDVHNVCVVSEDVQTPTKHDITNDEPDDYVPVLGLTLVLPEESASSSGHGVAIASVDRAGLAAEEGLKAGNVILEAAAKKVFHPTQVIAAIANAKREGQVTILMRIKTTNTTRLVQFALAGF